jgi:hypothetical protein
MQVEKSLFALAALSMAAGAQSGDSLFGIGFGAKGGWPFTRLLETTGVIGQPVATFFQSDNFLVGPVFEIRMPLGFAFEADGLYRGTQYNLANAGTLPTVFHSESWEVPYLGKFRFPIPLLKPFLVGGGSYRAFTNLPSNVNVTHNAVVAGGGLELRIARVRISGEARYLHWGHEANNLAVRLAQDQGEVLFGILFAAK